MRKLKRMVARNNMKKKGLIRFCKATGETSYFAEHWREYVRR